MDYELTKDHILSIRLTLDGFSFSIHHASEDESMIYRDFPCDKGGDYIAHIEGVIEKNPELLYSFGNVYVVVATDRFLQMPQSLDIKQKREQVYAFTHGPNDDVVLSCENKVNSLLTIFGIESKLYHYIKRTFDITALYHSTHILSSYFSNRMKFGNYDKLICQIQNKTADLIAIKRGNVTLINQYRFKQVEDVIYYILATWQKIGFSSTRDQLQFYGEASLFIKMQEIIKPYIDQFVPLVGPTDIIQTNNESPKVPFELIALPLCV